MTTEIDYTKEPEDLFYKRANQICTWVIILCLVVSLSVIRVSGKSMEPVLHDGECYLAHISHSSLLKHGDIIVLKVDSIENERLVKTLVGKEGDTYQQIISKEGLFYYYINKQKIVESYPDYEDLMQEDIVNHYEVTLGKREVFVLGANIENSCDSRIFGVQKIPPIVKVVKARRLYERK